MNKIKSIVKLIIPQCWWPEISFFRHLLLSRDAKNLKKIKFLKTREDVIVLGNGPSLKNDMEKVVKNSNNYDFVCVNNFCTSPYYETIKPSKYIFLDDYFFSENAHPDWIKQRESTFKTINEKTHWAMQVFLPPSANDRILKKFIKNTNVEIIKIKVVSYDNLNFKKIVQRFDTGYFGPYQGNVLIYAVYLSIWAKHKRIKIFGADLSFHKDIEVNQKNNNVDIRFRHFNREDHVERLMKNPEKIHPFSMSEIMQTTADSFRAHELLNHYAIEKNVEIENCSSFSFIDAYIRNGLV